MLINKTNIDTAMKVKHYLILFSLIFTVFSACKKDKETGQSPVVKMKVEGTALNVKIYEEIAFVAVNVNDQAYDQEWKLDGEVKSNSSTYNFTPVTPGVYTVAYTATNSGGVFTYTYNVNVGVLSIPVTPGSNVYVTTMFEFVPAPGQNTNRSLGSIAAAKSLEGKEGFVSLGAWGGYIVMGFDHNVINEPGKEDIIIYGNPQFNFAEPGIVWVMQDKNGNGKPDDTWYEIKGSEYGNAGYVRDHEVTYTKPVSGGDVSWRDNKGNTGTVKSLNSTFQSYPSWVTVNEYTLKGSLLPSTGIKQDGLITSDPFASGYADNQINGDKIDIADAMDQDGKTVALGGIDFIKIQTGIQANLGHLGEFSTELLGIADLRLVK